MEGKEDQESFDGGYEEMTEDEMRQMLEYREQLLEQLEQQRALQAQLEQLQQLRSQMESSALDQSGEGSESDGESSLDNEAESHALESKADSTCR